MKKGDRVEITKTNDRFIQIGDKATLTHRTEEGEELCGCWWADFDNRDWGDGDRNFCIQDGVSECKVIEQEEKLKS